ncbi:MAG TPA: two-component regulator propeller domain-containing protein [Candidatus Kapabacteria bacterium]|nr:two-component regulator propeller domain-containing protein [Candidatus Kapabacteria bacterium]
MKHIYKLLFVFAALFIAASAQAQQWQTWNTSNTRLPSDSIVAMCVDPSGNIYVCIQQGGFGRFNGLHDTVWTDLYDSVGHGYPQQVYYFKGNLWVYCYNGPGVQKFNGTTWAPYTNPVDNYASFFTSDNKGQLWMCGEGVEVLRTNGQWNHFSNTQPFTHFPDNNPSAMACDSNGNTWVAFTYDQGVVKLNNATGQGTYITPDSAQYANLSNRPIRSIAVDWSGNIWCATLPNGNVGGVYRINADGSGGYLWSTDSSISWISNDVRTVAVDHCGHVWIGTDGGAAMFDGSNWTIMNTFNTPSLPSDSINVIYVDAGGHIWFGTDQGLAEYKPAPLTVTTYYPANSATVTTDTVTCFWAWDCSNISRYYFEYADNSSFNNSTIDTTLVTFTTGNPGKHLANLVNGKTYYWRVKAENDGGYGPFSSTQQFSVNTTSAVHEDNSGIVNGFDLQQNYPNPFSDETTIRFSVPQRENVSLKVYDVLGREVATLAQGEMERGAYSVPFDATNLSQTGLHSGLYFYRLQAGDVTIEHTMQVLR